MSVPAKIAPKKIMINALTVSLLQINRSTTEARLGLLLVSGIKLARAIATPKNKAGNPTIITPIAKATPLGY